MFRFEVVFQLNWTALQSIVRLTILDVDVTDT